MGIRDDRTPLGPPPANARSHDDEEMRYRAFFNRDFDGVVILDPATARPVEFNDQACRQLGYTREEFARLSLHDIDAVQSADDIARTIATVLRDGKADFDTQHRTREGELREVRVTAQLIHVGAHTYYHCVWRDITERKAAAEALRLSEQRYRSLFEHMVEGFAYARLIFEGDDPVDLQFLEVNNAFRRLMGLGDVVGRCVSQVVPGIRETDPELFRRFGAVARTGRPDRFEYQVAALGTWIDYSLYSTEPDHVVAVFDVITARKQAEAELRESREKFRSIAEQLTDLIAQTDARGVVLYASPASRRLFGYEPEEAIGKHFTSFLDPSAVPGAMAAFAEVSARGGRTSALELRMRRKDGTTFLGEVSSTTFEVNGEVGRLVTIRDITDRRRADEQLEVLKHAIEQAPAAAYWLDSEGRFTYVNDAGCRALGYTRDELLSMTVGQVNERATPDRWKEIWDTLKRRGALSFNSEHRRKDGSLFPVDLTSMYVSYRGQEYCTGFAVDTTERHRAERENQALQAQLLQAQKMESIGRLAGGVAHDNNNMLCAILGNVELALNEAQPGSRLHADLLEIQAAAQRSADLTGQLLAFARRQTVAPRVLDVNESISGMLKMVRRLIGESIELEWQPRDTLWPVRIDPSQMTQVLTNLSVNARDAVGHAGRVRITTDHRVVRRSVATAHGEIRAGEYVVIAVEDNGCGMTPEVVEHLFEPFYTTKLAGAGTGLGMATVYGIVHQNGGFIEVQTEPGVGTRVTVGLPRHTELTSEETASSTTPTGGGETVLLVEDERAILQIGRRMLEGLGYRVLAAETPFKAIELASQHPGRIDLLVTDVVMPEMNGRDLAKRLLAMFPGLRRLFMSGYTDDVIAHHGVLEEGVHFLQKPFTARSLAAKVREALE